jgi:predicted RNase H-like HicB family nuclease
MLTYRAAYRMRMGMFVGEVPDVPEATGFGVTVGDARSYLLAALRLACEQRLRRGEMLPLPAFTAAADAYVQENVTVMPDGDGGVSVRAG